MTGRDSKPAPVATKSTKQPPLKDTAKPEGVTKKTKSRNGCRECKAKRLKCDETKPDCQQCTRRGKQCPGYVKDFKFSAKHERLHSGGKQAKHGAQATFSAYTPPVKAQPPQSPQTPYAPPIAETQHVLDFKVPPHFVPPARQDSASHVEPPSPGTSSSHNSSSPRSGYLSWSEVLSPAPTIDEDEVDDAGSQSPYPHSYGDAMMDVKAEQGPESPVSLPKTPEVAKGIPAANQQVVRASPKMHYTPIDLPSTLIEYWFANISSMWSAYDSEQNPNRQLALSNHTNSESVFYALQSMSAAYRVDSLPHLKPILTTSLASAMAAIRRELDVHYDLMPRVKAQLPVDLLLAMFAMATSLCWTDTSQLGEQLVVGARALLDLYGMSEDSLSEEDRKHLLHFRHALKYMEMLHNFVNPDVAGVLKPLRTRRRNSDESLPPRKSHANARGKKVLDEYGLHPWTGVSGEVQEKFGFVMALCRAHLQSRKVGRIVDDEDDDDLTDLELAQELAQDLRDITIESESSTDSDMGEAAETGDSRTPLSHLTGTAEAYRLAALLQLYLTFSDLHVRKAGLAPGHISSIGDIEVLPRDQALVSLTLDLVGTLQRIPADSGTRCIQPVLYISAATGLRFDMPVNARLLPVAVTECTLEVSKARQFVVDRLATLQRNLPPRPISVALKLIKAIWEEYDYGGQRHWIDVMREDPALQTLFG